ncbi:hypothetical protein [Halomonas sp. BM-2019]|uniref:RraA family protein n=1 Tax=Halomonas sp. BM-2019 TaxID=2811227 RepID=UPI001B3C2063|nr:MAG: hypothetical protein J5F18_03760 [Halomonas sp. BM-2019]
MPYVTNDGLARALLYVGSAALSDVLDEAGFPNQVVMSGFLRLGDKSPFCGPAVCVKGEARTVLTTQVPEGALQPLYYLTSLDTSGAVLVVASQGFSVGALIGDRISLKLKQNGCLGVITDGLARDSDELTGIGLPVRAKGVTPINGGKRWAITQSGVPVALPAQVGGTVMVAPGDFILADQDGVVVVPKDISQEVVSMAEELLLKEGNINSAKDNEQASRLIGGLYDHIKWLRNC